MELFAYNTHDFSVKSVFWMLKSGKSAGIAAHYRGTAYYSLTFNRLKEN